MPTIGITPDKGNALKILMFDKRFSLQENLNH